MNVRPLSSALQHKAETELNEVPSRVEDDLKQIKDWIAKQSHLKIKAGDQWILSFLRLSKFSLQKTKQKLETNCMVRSLIPEYFKERDPLLPEIQDLLKRSAVLFLPETSGVDGSRIIIVRAGESDPEKLPATMVARVLFMMLDILLIEDDNFVVGGQEVIIDLRNLSYKYVVQFTPSILRNIVWCLQYAYPSGPKALHILHGPSYVQSIFNILKTVLKPKMLDRITLYSDKDFTTLYNNVPRSILPKEYGGEGDSIDKLAADMKLKVESYREWFLENVNYYSEESKHPKYLEIIDNMFGTEGSFRKLQID